MTNRSDARYADECSTPGLSTTYHATYMREWRARHKGQTEEQRIKANARSYANVYKRRCLIVPQPCQNCGSAESQMHHSDYSQPLLVEWLCRPCHLAHHREEA